MHTTARIVEQQIREKVTEAVRLQHAISRDPSAPRLTLDQLIRDLAHGRQQHEQTRYCEEVAERNSLTYDPNRPFIEFRDLTAGVDSALIGTDVLEAADILRPYSILTQLGVEIVAGLRGHTVVPSVTATSLATWLGTEATGASLSEQTLSGKTLTPRHVGAVVQWSRRLDKQAANLELMVQRDLLRTIGAALDQAMLAGASPNAQPDGLFYTPGVVQVSGASLPGASVNIMAELSAAANAPDEQLAFVGTPAVRRLLQGRERATGSGFIWDHSTVSDHRAVVTTNLPAASLVCGPWPLVLLGIFGSGFTVEINPYDPSLFKRGVIQARLLVTCDVAVRSPGSFVWASSVS